MQILIRYVPVIPMWPVIAFLMLCGSAFAAGQWFDIGLTELRLNHYERAIDAFSRAIEEDPENYQAYNNRGIAWSLEGEYDRAIADYTAALEIAGASAEVYSNRGAAWFHKLEYDRAIEDYNRALGADPAFFKAYSNRGAARFSKGEKAKAMSDYKMALEIDPDSVETRRQLEWIMAAENKKTNPGQTNPLKDKDIGFCIQAGAFLSMKNAQVLTKKLADKGYEARVVPFKDRSDKTWYTVRIGNYASRREAEKEAGEFSANEQISAIVMPGGRI
ncbi:putative TPR repeat family protein [uncultured Desulfobacterium sp.]|uniref:Putative TPR repeat family protein n=1 Tax=uncultured Desulfobacterium sp. TaxID=201089 RepID=A0A445MXU7_9BACT|nr:putative TPR repeat family protein [uncultured Desulfobacterium sp.]